MVAKKTVNELKKYHIARSTQWRLNNRERANENSRNWQQKNRHRFVLKKKDEHLQRTYNITLEEFNNIIIQQNNKCPICNRNNEEIKGKYCVDHDHKTGKIRGVICLKCNVELGWFEKYSDEINNYLNKFNFSKDGKEIN